MDISTSLGISGSGRVNMLTRNVPAARATVATGASGKIYTDVVSDTWKCGSLSFIITHPPEDIMYEIKC